jgi:large subunit ribosomal protein L18
MTTNNMRVVRHKRIRKRITGTTERPRLAFFKSLQYVYAQIIDDSQGITLLSASTIEKTFQSEFKDGSLKNKNAAKKLGEICGKRLQEKGIKTVVFDRGGFQYHGVVKEFADAVRKEGIQF